MQQNSVNISADLVVYGKIFTSEDNQIVEAFAVKDGKVTRRVPKPILRQVRQRFLIIQGRGS